MPEEVDRLAALIGEVKGGLDHLAREFENHKHQTVKEQREVHNIVVATSEAIRNLTRTVDEMKPLTDSWRMKAPVVEEMKPLVDDYRTKRDQASGIAKFAVMLWVTVGGAVVIVFNRITEAISSLISSRPHP